VSYRELFISPPLLFAGSQRTFQEADYVVLGAPLDATGTHRSGARFAPSAIREASLHLETHSFRAGVDLEDLRIHDAGDLHVAGEVGETLRRLELVVRDLREAEKLPVILGGEHTVTLGAVRGIDGDMAVVSFDAHLDLRGEYLGQAVSHATSMRRITEHVGAGRILEIGVRAACREELKYAEGAGVRFLTAQWIRREGAEKAVEKALGFLRDAERIYLSVDMDVLDPAFAPAVQNPEPDGLSTGTFLDILCGVCDRRVAALDVVEVAPHYDRGATAVQAAKAVFEALCHVDRSRRASG